MLIIFFTWDSPTHSEKGWGVLFFNTHINRGPFSENPII